MKLEEAIGEKLAWLRNDRQLTQAQLGESLGRYLEKPWSRQAVNSAERGNRSFTAKDLVALALALDTSVPSLLLPLGSSAPVIDMPSGEQVPAEEYRKLSFHPSDLRGRTTGEAWDSMRRLFSLYTQLMETHSKVGAELDHGLQIISSAVQVELKLDPEVPEEVDSDG